MLNEYLSIPKLKLLINSYIEIQSFDVNSLQKYHKYIDADFNL